MKNTTKPSRPVLVVGMHRSGTSMVAGLLHKAGVFLGDRLLGAGEGNPYGHFEEEGLVEFHRRVLARRAEVWPLSFDDGSLRSKPVGFIPSAEEDREASGLLATLRRPGLWGWKDPRTCLLLSYWLEKLPDAFVVAVYRHPLEVYDSHLRRANNLDLAWNPGLIWESFDVYNQSVLEEADRSPERFLFVSASGVATHPGRFLEVTAAHLGGEVSFGSDANAFVRRKELSSGWLSVERHEMARVLYPESVRTFESLDQRSSMADESSGWNVRGAGSESEKLEFLQSLSKAVNGLCSADLLPLMERWALPLTEEERIRCREKIFGGIQTEISERDRVLGEVRRHQVESAEYAKQVERDLARVWDERNRMEGERDEVSGERDEALRRVGALWDQVQKQMDYARELEARIGDLEKRLALVGGERDTEKKNLAAAESALREASLREEEWRKVEGKRFFRLARKLGLLS